MSVDAFIDAREGTVRPADEALGAKLVALPGVQHAAPKQLPLLVRRRIESSARVVVPAVAGGLVALAAEAGLKLALTVVAAWLLHHLVTRRRWLGSSVPAASEALGRVAVPFAAAATAVVAGLLPERSLADALLVTTGATAGLVLTALVREAVRRPRRVIVVGDRGNVGRAAVTWSVSREVTVVGACLVGSASDDGLDGGLETFGLPAVQADELAEAVGRLDADLVVVLPSPDVGATDIRRLGWAVEDTAATLVVKTDLDSAAPHRLAVSRMGDCPVVEVAPSRAPWHVRAAKGVVDRVGGAVLLTLVSPLLLAMVLAVRLETPGPGLFTQERVGRDGRRFKVYKLRTMCARAEDIKEDLGHADEGNGVLFKIREDPRVTRVGRPLRRTSLDELPQLINVVKGQMSLVGPRPALPEEVAQYDETARRRLAVRPGMTGLWQVSGRSDLDWDTAVSLDLRYTDNVTVSEDLRICLRTVGAVTSGRGAY
jgi:exopolysaccharide biosynthesis polyprenyl glycosylphosphotransferase